MVTTNRTESDPRSAPAVLIVEDEAVIAEDLYEFLQALGYRVTERARSAAEAIRAVERERFDLILMDINLRGRPDGIQATVEIEDRFGVPVIYLSGCMSAETSASVVCSQPYGFVSKPYDSKHLAEIIARALQGPGAMAGAPMVH